MKANKCNKTFGTGFMTLYVGAAAGDKSQEIARRCLEVEWRSDADFASCLVIFLRVLLRSEPVCGFTVSRPENLTNDINFSQS